MSNRGEGKLNFGSAPGVVEGAYQLAASGECADLVELKKSLLKAGHTRGDIEDHFTSPTLKREIEDLIAKARPAT